MIWNSLTGDPLLVWGVFTRLLGLLLAWAIGQLYFQLPLLAGRKGIYSHADRLKMIRRDFGLWRGILYFPGLLWISPGDRMMRFLVILGVCSGLAIFVGVPGTWFFFLLCFLIYLSFDVPIGASYPWDSLLFEATLLAILLPPIELLPQWHAVAEPNPVLAFLYRFLLFRLLFGFGKYKFSKPNFKDSGYFRNFLLNVPLPSPLAYPLSNAPSLLFRGMYLFAFVAEMLIPFLLFIPGPPRMIAFGVIVVLMLGIQALANFGFFNVLTALLSLTLLDTDSLIWTDWSAVTGNALHQLFWLSILVFAVFTGIFSLPFNTWCSFTWMHWPSALLLGDSWLRYPVKLLRGLSRWRLVHAYGVFPVKSQPPQKLVPLIEGSLDGKEWKRYSYRYTLSDEQRRMPFVAPYHPRLDHFVFYDAFGINNTNFNWSTVGSCIPYDYTYRGGLDNVLQALLEKRGEVIKLFRFDPFPGTRPKYLRVGLYYAVPGGGENRWDLHLADVHRLPLELEKDYEVMSTSFPELFHWDAYFWRMRTKAGRNWKVLSRSSAFAEVLNELKQDIEHPEAFDWEQLSVRYLFRQSDWLLWPQMVRQFEQDFNPAVRRSVYRYWNRLRIVLGHRMEKQFLDKDKKLLAGNYFYFGLLLHKILATGPDMVRDLWETPEKIHHYAVDFDPLSAFYIEAFFRPEATIDLYRKNKWADRVVDEPRSEVLPGYNQLSPQLTLLPLKVSLDAWPEMNYHAANGEWTLGEPVYPGRHFPELYEAWLSPGKSPTPY